MLFLHEEVSDFSQQVLRTDVAGMPLEWIDYRDAVRLYYLEQVAYSFGSPLFRIHGGFNAATQRQSCIEVSSIIATVGRSSAVAGLMDCYLSLIHI